MDVHKEVNLWMKTLVGIIERSSDNPGLKQEVGRCLGLLDQYKDEMS
jgi:hypothetical protein